MVARIALGAIVKNEAPYVKEWAVYHQMLGFDPIIVYDNESTDGTTEVCRFLHDRGIIQHVLFPNPPLDGAEGPQILAYRDIVRHLTADWVAFLDADEFFCLERHTSVQEYVATHSGRSPIALNWKLYGSSDHLRHDTGLVIDRFRMRPRHHEANALVKTIAPLRVCHEGLMHVHIHGWPLAGGDCHYVDALGRPIVLEGNCLAKPTLWQGAWVNHYLIKSREEFEVKSRRGNADAAPRDLGKPTRTVENYFKPYDRNEVYDFCLERHVVPVQWRVDALTRSMKASSAA